MNKKIKESSAGLSKDFWKGKQEKPQNLEPIIGSTFISLKKRPHEVIVVDVRGDIVRFYDTQDQYGAPIEMSSEDFFNNYEMLKKMKEVHQAGKIDADMLPGQDDGFSPMVIDLGAHRAGRLDESWMTMFSSAVKLLMRGLLGNFSVPVSIKGTKGEIEAFTNAVSREKKYLNSISQYGLDDPRTYKSKGVLDGAISKFEKATGLKWPFRG